MFSMVFPVIPLDSSHFSETVTAFLGGASRQWLFAILLQERLRKAGGTGERRKLLLLKPKKIGGQLQDQPFCGRYFFSMI